MGQFNRLLIALDFSEADETVLNYTSDWCRRFGVEKLYFVNVQRDLVVPEKYRSYMLDVEKPLDEKLREDLESRISAYFPDYDDYDYEFDVIEGNPRDQITHWIKVKGVDLLVTGRKSEPHGRGILPQQLLRNSKCSVLFIPEGKSFSMKNIGVPVKLGSQEDLHLKVAMDWVEDGGILTVQHFYSIPSSYNHMITTTGMLLEGMKESAGQELDDLIGKFRSGDKEYEIRKVLRSVVEYNLSDAIIKFSTDNECTFLIMQSGGKSAIQTFLIGSETEAMVKKNTDFPLLIFK